MSLLDAAIFVDAVGALAAVLGLLGLTALGLRLWRARQGGHAAPRLAIVETLPVDGRHRLIRVRDGGREHLLFVGASGAFLVDGAPAQPEDAR